MSKESEAEKIYIIQPVMNEDYQAVHDEAKALIESAGAKYFGTSYQTVRNVSPATFIGSGKLQEIKYILEGMDDVTVLFNGDISPSQTLNISAALDKRKVIDRTTLILDIFARNAVSSEGKVQVELAQLKYIYPRLKGKGNALSRLGGGIGTRGPGETQLETDRRHIKTRIKYLEERLKTTETRRAQTIERREKNNAYVISLIGYTNTGKSTLLNTLTGSDVLEKDALFATLDPTARKFTIEGKEFVLIDTVGFLRELPHNIIEAFKSTLESAIHCDLALVVSDVNEDYEMQFQTAINTVKELGFDRKYIKVLNKCENVTDFSAYGGDCVLISAKYDLGLDELKRAILNELKDSYKECRLTIPYTEISDYNRISKYAEEKSREYTDTGITIEASVKNDYVHIFEKYMSQTG
ncbi:MAG: GTPase HflX [Clostridia bacterium]|nr:GTPase HflX [Clostridia bacterium]